MKTVKAPAVFFVADSYAPVVVDGAALAILDEPRPAGGAAAFSGGQGLLRAAGQRRGHRRRRQDREPGTLRAHRPGVGTRNGVDGFGRPARRAQGGGRRVRSLRGDARRLFAGARRARRQRRGGRDARRSRRSRGRPSPRPRSRGRWPSSAATLIDAHRRARRPRRGRRRRERSHRRGRGRAARWRFPRGRAADRRLGQNDPARVSGTCTRTSSRSSGARSTSPPA